jgi:hypothetical protein
MQNNEDPTIDAVTALRPADCSAKAFERIAGLSSRSIGDAALAYAAAGWPVFPCDPLQDPPGAKRRRSKAPLVPGPDRDIAGTPAPETGGLWRATTDEAQVRLWWAKHPTALIGVPTGDRVGLFVIDIDPRGETVDDVLKRLQTAIGPLPAGPVTVTQSGGLHLWFRNPAGQPLPRNSSKRLKGVDWRGQGGYVIVPPSVMGDGKAYDWSPGPYDLDFPQASARLLDLIYQRGDFARGRPQHSVPYGRHPDYSAADDDNGDKAVRRYALAAIRRAGTEMAQCPAGQRGHTLNAIAFSLGHFVGLNALSDHEVTAALQEAADLSGLTETDGVAERDAKIRRGLAAGARNPGDLDRTLARIREQAERHGSSEPRRTSQAAPLASTKPEGIDADVPPSPAKLDRQSDGPVTPLGHCGGIYFYLSKAGEVRRLKDQDHKKLPILSLFDGDDDWLTDHCPAYERSGRVRPGAWDQDAAARLLIRLCAGQGLFDPDTQLRGPGVWRTAAGRLVIHVGDALSVLSVDECLALADARQPLDWHRAGQVIDGSLFAATARCPRPAPQPAPRSAGQALLAGLKLWHYDDPLSADIILGFLGSAFLGGAPSWRVHLLLSAQAGSGKTWLMTFLEAALGGMATYANDATEAGLRQALTGESRVILLDEAEGDEGSSSKVEGVIRLLRLMSSGDGANVMRGSAGGRGQSFQVTGCAVMAAILPAPLKPQDRSRICVIDVLRPPRGCEASRAAEQVTAAMREIKTLAPGLRTRAIAGWPRFLDTFSLYRAGLIGRGLSGRNADTLATIMAGRDLLLQDCVPDTDSIELELELFAPFYGES